MTDTDEGVLMSVRYDEPGRIAKTGSAVIRWLAEAGVSIQGTQALRIRGRKSGELRSVVVNLMTIDRVDYLVSPRGNTQWARNARAAGEVETGSRWRRRSARITELSDEAKAPILKAYLDRWYYQVKDYVGGLTPQSTAAEMTAVAPTIPVFVLAR
jgi:deazaflavin-dependent oxidoreductase (nitroreductase family)